MSANRVTSAGTALVLTAFAFAACAAAQAPDPSCVRGIATGAFCCPPSCGTCGGAGCGARPGGSAMCCGGDIASSNRSCAAVGAPCNIAPPPAPATACGDFPATPSAGRKNVMLIGDSISMAVPVTPGGYGLNVRSALANISVDTWHAGGWGSGGQGSNTAKGVLCTANTTDGNYLNFTGTYDVIHFNYGLHDLDTAQLVPPAQYARNLAIIYARLAARAKTVVWATTTPCPNVTTSYGRSDALVREYNAAAMAALTAAAARAAAKLVVDDLYAAVIGYCGVDYKACDLQKPANVHFEPKGCAFLGDRVVQSIMPFLK